MSIIRINDSELLEIPTRQQEGLEYWYAQGNLKEYYELLEKVIKKADKVELKQHYTQDYVQCRIKATLKTDAITAEFISKMEALGAEFVPQKHAIIPPENPLDKPIHKKP